MKCYTVSLKEITDMELPIPGNLITEGVDVKMSPDGRTHQMYLGSAECGEMKYVQNALINGAKVRDNKIFDAHPLMSTNPRRKEWYLVRPRFTDECPDILVRIIGQTRAKLGLTLGGYTHGVKIIATGTGYDTYSKGLDSNQTEWVDVLVTIPPYSAVMVEQDGQDILAVVNSGGNPTKQSLKPSAIVITPEEYERNFLSHSRVDDIPVVVCNEMTHAVAV